MKPSRTLPSRLYKYVSMEGEREEWTKQTIERHTIYFAAPSSFNDPFDSKITVGLLTPQETLRQCEAVARNVEETLNSASTTLGNAAEHPTFAKPKFQSQHTDVLCTRDAVQKHENKLVTLQAEIKTMRAQMAELFQKVEDVQKDLYEVGVLCLSELPDSMLMWSHYVDSHMGICLEFDTACQMGSGLGC